MNTNNIIKALNLTEGDVLTLEKLADRMEFSAFAGLEDINKWGIETCSDKGTTLCLTYSECLIDCENFSFHPCSCDGPVGYIPSSVCHPYTGE